MATEFQLNPITGKLDLIGMSTADMAAYLKLDQSTPQTVTASPIFNWGTLNRVPFYSSTKTLTDDPDFQWFYNAVVGGGLSINKTAEGGGANKLTIAGDTTITGTGTCAYVNTSKTCTGTNTLFTSELAIGDSVSFDSDFTHNDYVSHITSDTKFETFANNLGYDAGSGKTLYIRKALLNVFTGAFTPSLGTFPSNCLLLDALGGFNIRQSITLPNGYSYITAGNANFISQGGSIYFYIDATEYGRIQTTSAQFGGSVANYELTIGTDGAGGATRETHYFRGGNNGGSANGNGCPLIISSGLGRGTASTQYLSLQTPVQLGSGTTLQSLVERLTFYTGLTAGGVGAVFNDTGADYDFRFEGDTDANLLYLDASTENVGVGLNNPTYKLDVSGTFRASTSITDGGLTATRVVFSGTGGLLSDNASLYYTVADTELFAGNLTAKGAGEGVVRSWNTTYSGDSSAQFQWWISASNYWTASATISNWILQGLGGGSANMYFEFNTANLGINHYKGGVDVRPPSGLSVSTAAGTLEESKSRTDLKAIAEFYASSSVLDSEVADRVRFCIGNTNPNINGSRSTTLLFWGYDNDEVYGGTTPIAHTEIGTDYWQNNSRTWYQWDSLAGQRIGYLDYVNGHICLGAGAGLAAQYDSAVGNSVFIGAGAGGSYTNASTMVCIGAAAGSNDTNGGACVYIGGSAGASTGGGDYNIGIGYGAAASKYYRYSTIIGTSAGSGAGSLSGEYGVILLDTMSRTWSARNSSPIFAQASTKPRLQWVNLNGDVRVQGLNSTTHREIGQARFNRFTGQQVFQRVWHQTVGMPS